MVEESDHKEFNLKFLLQKDLFLLKNFELISNSHIISGFINSQYLVKSYSRPNDPSHFVSVRDHSFISCDNNCPKYNKEGFCGHIIGVALKYNSLKSMLVLYRNARRDR